MTGTAAPWHVVLGSASPARLGLLRDAGIDAHVVVSGVDEDSLTAAWDPTDTAGLVSALARAKLADVLAQLGAVDQRTVVIAADSLFRFDGEAMGKPGSAAVAVERLGQLSGRSGHLLTGHAVAVLAPGSQPSRSESVAATEVQFASFDRAELEAYVATGEPLQVAGGFTLDGLAAPFIRSISGDPSNVIGLSLPLLRRMLTDLGVFWPELWRRQDGGSTRRPAASNT